MEVSILLTQMMVEMLILMAANILIKKEAAATTTVYSSAKQTARRKRKSILRASQARRCKSPQTLTQTQWQNMPCIFYSSEGFRSNNINNLGTAGLLAHDDRASENQGPVSGGKSTQIDWIHDVRWTLALKSVSPAYLLFALLSHLISSGSSLRRVLQTPTLYSIMHPNVNWPILSLLKTALLSAHQQLTRASGKFLKRAEWTLSCK